MISSLTSGLKSTDRYLIPISQVRVRSRRSRFKADTPGKTQPLHHRTLRYPEKLQRIFVTTEFGGTKTLKNSFVLLLSIFQVPRKFWVANSCFYSAWILRIHPGPVRLSLYNTWSLQTRFTSLMKQLVSPVFLGAQNKSTSTHKAHRHKIERKSCWLLTNGSVWSCSVACSEGSVSPALSMVFNCSLKRCSGVKADFI